MNLNTVVKIVADVQGTGAIKGFGDALDGAGKAADAAGRGFKKVLDSSLFRAAAVAATALGVAMGASAKAAIDFESAMADVRKVVAGLETPEAFGQIKNEILELSSEMPIAAQGFAAIYEAAGQSGVAREDLREFAETVAQVAVAFDVTAQDAGESMAKIQTALQLDMEGLRNLVDAINHLSNNMASSAPQIVDFMKRVGSAGQLAGLSAEQTAAFGSAMIAAGAEADVAATSFRKMISELASGEGMTDRQIQALEDLGFEIDDAVLKEQEFTDAVRSQSEARIDAARHETDQLAKELSRRYRDQMRSIQDNFEDESEAFRDSVEDKTDAQIDGLKQQERREIEAAKARADAQGRSANNEIEAIRKHYDDRIDALRDNARDTLKLRRRADRDRLQQIRDDMDDRKEAELNGLESNFNAIKNQEKALMDERLAEIKEQAKAGAVAAAKALSEGLQEDAIGTITDVFDRINQLPRSEQLRAIQDLFGEEARAILPLVNNSQLLENALRLVGDESEYAGSTLQEYLVRTGTTANQIQLAQNQIQNLAIAFGENLAPALSALITALAPVIEAFTWLIQNVPGLGPALAVLSAAFVGLVAILPALGAIVQIVGAFGGFAAVIPTVVAALAPLKALLVGIVAVLTGPASIAIAIGAVLAAIYVFRDEIGAFFVTLGEVIVGFGETLYDIFVQPFIDAFQAVVSFVADSWVGELIGKIGGVLTWFKETFTSITDLILFPFRLANKLFMNAFVDPLIDMVTGARDNLGSAWTKLGELLLAPFNAALNFVNDKFIDPIKKTISALASGLSKVWEKLKDTFIGPFEATIDFLEEGWATLQEVVSAPFIAAAEIIREVLNNVISGVENTINGAISAINRLIAGANRISGVVGIPAIQQINAVELPRFANGGLVAGPTMAIVGEGGQPEYIIPQSKADGFAQNWMAGIRGPAAIPRFADGGMVTPANANVSIQTGPVTQMNGTNYVTTQEMSAAVQAGVKQTLDLIRRDGNTRASLGFA